MSHTYTPPAFPQFIPAGGPLTNPDDGDALLAASVNVAFEPLADRSKLAYLGLYGVQGATLMVNCLTSDTIEIETTPIIRSTTRVLSGTIAPFSAATVYGAALAASTTYYVYVADSAGTLVPIVSTDPPDVATRKYRNGNGDQAFITYFRTDSGANVRHFTHYQGFYTFLDQILVVARTDPGTATPVTAALADVPDWARVAQLQVTVFNLDALLSAQYNLSYPGVTTEFQKVTCGVKGAVEPRVVTPLLAPIAGTTGFDYIRDTGSGTADIAVSLQGVFL